MARATSGKRGPTKMRVLISDRTAEALSPLPQPIGHLEVPRHVIDAARRPQKGISFYGERDVSPMIDARSGSVAWINMHEGNKNAWRTLRSIAAGGTR